MDIRNSKLSKALAAFVGIMTVFAVVAVPAAQAATNHYNASGYQFTRNLSMGMTGTDVQMLQRVLNTDGTNVANEGYGSRGMETMYFGSLTQSAVHRYQNMYASAILHPVGLTNATGFVGPSTRAHLNALPRTMGDNDDEDEDEDTNNDGLSGGEASLEDYELESEESSGSEGEENVELATATFDVEDGDARVERIEVDFQAEDTTDSVRPWDYFETVSIWVDGDMIDEMDVDSSGDWDENNDDSDHSASSADWYRLTFTGLDYVVDEGETAEITIAATIAGTIDSTDLTQEFTILIDDEGIRATDAEGIQQYTGDNTEVVDNFGFDAEESGDLDVESSSDDPDSTTLISDADDESDEYTVFIFDIDNNDNADALVTDLTIDVATTGMTISNLIDSATLVVGGEEYTGDVNSLGASVGTIDFDDIDVEIAGDSAEEFELVITLKEDAVGSLTFSIDAADVTAEGVDSGDDSDVSGSADGEQHTVALTGIMVEAVSTDSSVNDDGTVGTFEITFTVEALEDDAFIYNGADNGDDDATPFSAVASTTGVVYSIFSGGTATTTFSVDSAILQRVSNVDTDGNYYKIDQGETGTLRLTVTLDPAALTTALYYVELDAIRFDDVVGTAPAGGTNDDTTYIVPDDGEFQTDAESLEAA